MLLLLPGVALACGSLTPGYYLYPLRGYSDSLLVHHPRLQSLLRFTKNTHGLFRDRRVHVEDDVADAVVRLEVLAEDVDAARGEARVDLGEHAGDVAVDVQDAVRALLRRQGDGGHRVRAG